VAPFTILLVEDDLDLRDALVESLREEGYAVDWAGDGVQALAYLRNGGRPGLILLDLMMPRMGGAEFRKVQRVDPKLRHLPVVLLSADARMDERARELDVQGAIRKPIDLEELLAVIERYRATPINRTTA
jgi:two-component system response regulator MprA